MFVAISQRHIKHRFGDRDCLEQAYTSFFEKFGFVLLPLPNKTGILENYFDLPIERVILSGGNDICPETYSTNEPPSNDCSFEREVMEKKLLDLAISRRLPVLGICRGLQFINVYFGGKLIKNIKGHVSTLHEIEIMGEAQGILGKKSHVNSYHNDGVTSASLSTNLNVFAYSSDKIIEGIYHPTLPIAGIQWHPERASPNKEADTNLIKLFLARELFWK